MMLSNQDEKFFFFLQTGENLPKSYYQLADELSRLDVMLIPVKVEQISQIVSLTEAPHVIVICSSMNTSEFQHFNSQIAPVLTYLIKQTRLTMFHLSSFNKLDQSIKLYLTKRYFFLKYPISLQSTCAKLLKYYEIRATNQRKWPGGKRTKLPALSA